MINYVLFGHFKKYLPYRQTVHYIKFVFMPTFGERLEVRFLSLMNGLYCKKIFTPTKYFIMSQVVTYNLTKYIQVRI